MLIASNDYLKCGKFSNTVAAAGAIQCDTLQDSIVPWCYFNKFFSSVLFYVGKQAMWAAAMWGDGATEELEQQLVRAIKWS